MSTRTDIAHTLKVLQNGPRTGVTPPTENEVQVLSRDDRTGYLKALKALLRKLSETQLKSPGKNIAEQFARFSEPWVRSRADGASRFYAGYVDAYVAAVDAGMSTLDWQDPEQAKRVASTVEQQLPEYETQEGMAWRIVLGQLQSLFCRETSAQSFQSVRDHESASLVSSFYWDMGVFTYYSENHIRQSSQPAPSLSALTKGSSDTTPGSDHAIVISMDESFFRTFAPIILLNAQQTRGVDFVILLCADTGKAEQLMQDAERYMSGLSSLNLQSAPSNLHVRVTPQPGWAKNPKTFYASIRFLALPELLEQYKTVYCMDADLFMMQNPRQFLRGAWSVAMSAPMNKGLLSVIPWRRYMAGNVVVTQAARGSAALQHFVDYLTFGLSERFSWMLDQNALSYVAEMARDSEFGPLDRARPGATARFMGDWEQNYRRATKLTR